MSKNPRLQALQRAIDAVGTQAELARRISGDRKPPIKQQHIWNWLNRDEEVPAEYVLAIERETGVSRHDIRPDIYPREAVA